MTEKMVRGDRLWRSLALLILCTLVYYLSYDHGRQAVQGKFEAYRLGVLAEAEVQRQEVLRLNSALAQCRVGISRERNLATTPKAPKQVPTPKVPSREASPKNPNPEVAPKVSNQEVFPKNPNPVVAPKGPNQEASPKNPNPELTSKGPNQEASPKEPSPEAPPKKQNDGEVTVSEADIFLKEEILLRDKMSLRIDQSRILFDGRLVVTLLDLDISRNRAILQLNFINEARILTGELEAGKNFKFPLAGGYWALAVDELSVSTAQLSLVEFKEGNQ